MHENYNKIFAFVMVAKEQSFTKAAYQLNISQSALSRTIKQLEKQLGLALFNRTTRSLSLTEAGEKLFRTANHSFTTLDTEVKFLTSLMDTPSGKVRITASRMAIEYFLLPKLANFHQKYPDIDIELLAENRLVDIVAERFDAGIRFGNIVSDGMIATKISADIAMVVVGSTQYFARNNLPMTIDELAQHSCIGFRYQHGGMYEWDFLLDGQSVKFLPKGQWIFSEDETVIKAVKLGLGLGYVPRIMVQDEIEKGEFIPILEPFWHTYTGFYLYYPHRNISPAFKAVLKTLKADLLD